MEHEARLAMLDHGLPRTELQHLIRGHDGERWRASSWPEARVAAEYESVDCTPVRAAMMRATGSGSPASRETGWIVIPIVVSDVRQTPAGCAHGSAAIRTL